MIALLKRQIQDAMVMFGLGLLVVIVVNALVWFYSFDRGYVDEPALGVPGVVGSAFTVAILSLSFIALGLGILQSYLDQTRKASAFLATLALRRERIFLARILAGLAIVAGTFLILLAGFGVFLVFRPPVRPLDGWYIGLSILTGFLLIAVSYSLGAMFEHGKNRPEPVLATFGLWGCVLWLALMKIDLGPLAAVLSAITVAALLYGRQRFLAAAL